MYCGNRKNIIFFKNLNTTTLSTDPLALLKGQKGIAVAIKVQKPEAIEMEPNAVKAIKTNVRSSLEAVFSDSSINIFTHKNTVIFVIQESEDSNAETQNPHIRTIINTIHAKLQEIAGSEINLEDISAGIFELPEDLCTNTPSCEVCAGGCGAQQLDAILEKTFEHLPISMNTDPKQKTFAEAIMSLIVFPHQIREAIEKGWKGFEIEYQPQCEVTVDDNGDIIGEIVSVEALLRFILEGEEGDGVQNVGKKSPEVVLKIIESLKKNAEFQKFLLQKIIAFAKANPNIPVALNTTQYDLEDSTFAQNIVKECKDQDVKPKNLKIEIVEHLHITEEKKESIQTNLNALAKIGCNFAIDDYKTTDKQGDHIQMLKEVQTANPETLVSLKIDKKYKNEPDTLKKYFSLADENGFNICAEAVEDEAEVHAYLNAFEQWKKENPRKEGDTRPYPNLTFQGWAFKKAVSLEDFAAIKGTPLLAVKPRKAPEETTTG